MRSLHTAMKSSPCSPQLEKARAQQWRPNAAKKKKKKVCIKKIYIQSSQKASWECMLSYNTNSDLNVACQTGSWQQDLWWKARKGEFRIWIFFPLLVPGQNHLISLCSQSYGLSYGYNPSAFPEEGEGDLCGKELYVLISTLKVLNPWP